MLTAKQIDNLSVIGRSALELLRILPGVVTEFNQGESVSFGGGGNNTQGYTVNGIRASSNTVSLDGSSLIDIGSNNGVIVSLNNDMVQEVKVQSSNFAAEYGTGGMNVSGVTKSGTSQVPRLAVRLLARPSLRRQRPLEQHHPDARSRRARISIPAATSAVPITFGDSYTKNRDRLFFFVAFEGQRQQVDSGSQLHAHVLAGDEERRLQRAARQPRLEPEQRSAAAHPAGATRMQGSRRRTTTCGRT